MEAGRHPWAQDEAEVGARLDGLGGTEIVERNRIQGSGQAFAWASVATAAAGRSLTRSHQAAKDARIPEGRLVPPGLP